MRLLLVVMFATTAGCATTERSEDEKLHGCWDWSSGSVPGPAGLFRYWTFAPDGTWSVTDGVCAAVPGTWQVNGPMLVLSEDSSYSESPEVHRFRMEYSQTGLLRLTGSDGLESYWQRYTAPLQPAVRHASR